jgi:hypothetical protein
MFYVQEKKTVLPVLQTLLSKTLRPGGIVLWFGWLRINHRQYLFFRSPKNRQNHY